MIMNMNHIAQYQTNYTVIDVYETDIKINSETMYVIISTNKITHKQNTRFGNGTQTKSIINTYNLEKRFKL